MCIASYYLILF